MYNFRGAARARVPRKFWPPPHVLELRPGAKNCESSVQLVGGEKDEVKRREARREIKGGMVLGGWTEVGERSTESERVLQPEGVDGIDKDQCSRTNGTGFEVGSTEERLGSKSLIVWRVRDKVIGGPGAERVMVLVWV